MTTRWHAVTPQDEEKASELRAAAEKVAALREWFENAGWFVGIEYEREGKERHVKATVTISREMRL